MSRMVGQTTSSFLKICFSIDAEVAREVFDILKNHERRQVIHVFMEGGWSD